MNSTGNIALALRILVFYPAAAFAGAWPSVSWDQTTGLLTIDVNALSGLAGAALFAVVSGGTFAWSRAAKSAGKAT